MAPVKLILREATHAELREVAGMDKKLIEHESELCPFEELEHHFSEEQLYQRFLQYMQDGKKVLVLQNDKDKILGYSLITLNDIPELGQRRCEINQFYLRLTSRGSGYGKIMFELLCNQFCPPTTIVLLNVIEKNIEGLGFWRRMGFDPYFVNMYRTVGSK